MKIAIYGYGNLGKGVECAVMQNADMELFGIFTRRPVEDIKPVGENVKIYPAKDVLLYKNEIDVMIICGGSATDLPVMTPALAENFNVIDSFWGKGVSQGHSDAIRRIEGVEDARQYTIPVPTALDAVRRGENPVLSAREKHTRECFVVAKEGADKARIENEIKTMPNYFADYDTTVHFISKEELMKHHSGIPHGGLVIRSGKTGQNNENSHIIEYSLKLDSNPEFTASVLAAYARAAFKMRNRGETGCKTVFDIAPADLSALSAEEIRAHML